MPREFEIKKSAKCYLKNGRESCDSKYKWRERKMRSTLLSDFRSTESPGNTTVQLDPTYGYSTEKLTTTKVQPFFFLTYIRSQDKSMCRVYTIFLTKYAWFT